MKKIVSISVAVILIVGIVMFATNGNIDDNQVSNNNSNNGVAIQEQDTNVAGDSPVLSETEDEIGSLIIGAINN